MIRVPSTTHLQPIHPYSGRLIAVLTQIQIQKYCLFKDLDTIGNCQRPVSSLGVPQHMHKINLWKIDLNWSSKLRDNNGRKNTLVTQSCVLSDAWFGDRKIYFWGLEIKLKYFSGKLLLSRKLCYFRGSRFSQDLTTNSSPLLVAK